MVSDDGGVSEGRTGGAGKTRSLWGGGVVKGKAEGRTAQTRMRQQLQPRKGVARRVAEGMGVTGQWCGGSGASTVRAGKQSNSDGEEGPNGSGWG